MKKTMIGFPAEQSLGPPLYNYAGIRGIASARPSIGMSQQSRGLKCNITCYGHSCSIECEPGEWAGCECYFVNTQTGGQWLPRCRCHGGKAENIG